MEGRHRPYRVQRHGEHSFVTQGQKVLAGIEQYPALEIVAAAIRQPPKALPVPVRQRSGNFDFDTPGLRAPCHDDVHLDLIVVTVVPETQVRVRPSRLGDKLLNYKRLQ